METRPGYPPQRPRASVRYGSSSFYTGSPRIPRIRLIIASLSLLILGFLVFLFIMYYQKSASPQPYFIYDPYDAKNVSTWVAPSVNNTALVDISVATEYHSAPSLSGQKYVVPGLDIQTVFTLVGYYRGEKFRLVAFEDSQAKMRITPELSPGDGVLDAYAFERIEGDVLRAYFFFDQDWVDLYGDSTYIISGKYLNQSRKAVFTEAREGVYYDAVEDDQSRFADGIGGASVYGGVIAGTFDPQQMLATPPQQVNAIMIS